MTPVIQTVTEAGKGNCLAACIASILEIPIGDIPDLKCGSSPELGRFLATKGLAPIWLWCKWLESSYVGDSPAYCIAIGRSPRRAVNHAVVARPNGYGYEILHDPHPEGGGLDGPIRSVIYFGSLL